MSFFEYIMLIDADYISIAIRSTYFSDFFIISVRSFSILATGILVATISALDYIKHRREKVVLDSQMVHKIVRLYHLIDQLTHININFSVSKKVTLQDLYSIQEILNDEISIAEELHKRRCIMKDNRWLNDNIEIYKTIIREAYRLDKGFEVSPENITKEIYKIIDLIMVLNDSISMARPDY